MPVDPVFEDSLAYSGIELRNADLMMVMGTGTALAARSGIRPGDPGLTVTLSGTTINVSAGAAVIAYPGQGVYRVALPSAVSPGAYNAPHATFSRIDLVYLRVWDTDVDSSGLRQADVVYMPGAASSAPGQPTPPAPQIFIRLATINVPPSGGGAASVNSAVRTYTVAPGGILPSSTAPSALYTGQYYDDGTNLYRYNGTAWRQTSPTLPSVSDQVSSPGTYTAAAFTDFTSAQWPPITVTVPPSGMVAISIGAAVRNSNTTTSTGWAAWRASGTITEASSEKTGVATAGGRTYATRRVIRSGLTPGASLTITPQYQFSSVNASSATTQVEFGQLIVEPIAG